MTEYRKDFRTEYREVSGQNTGRGFQDRIQGGFLGQHTGWISGQNTGRFLGQHTGWISGQNTERFFRTAYRVDFRNIKQMNVDYFCSRNLTVQKSRCSIFNSV